MSAWRRVVRAPGLVALVAALHLLLAAAVGGTARAVIGRSLGSHAVVDDGHTLYAALELLIGQPGLLAGYLHLAAGSAILALAFWTLLAAGILHRLHGPATLPRLAAAAVRGLPGVLAVTLWHLPLRALLLTAVGGAAVELLGAGAWGLVGLLVTFAVAGYCTCALDLARCDVVLHGARRFHPYTALRGYLQAASCQAVLIPSLLMSLGRWLCVAGIVVAAFAGLAGGPAIWLARALAVLGIVFSLTRIAVAVEAGPYR